MKKKATAKGVKRPRSAVVATLVEAPVPYLLLRLSGVVDEHSTASIFARVREKLMAAKPKRVLVDMRDCRVVLTISDLHGLAKTIAAAFAGTVERLALVLQERDILPEKFFEPALTSRGLPTLTTPDYDEAVYWLSIKLRRGM